MSCAPQQMKSIVSVSVERSSLAIVPRGAYKIWSLRRRVTIPLSQIAGCTVTRRPDRERPIRSRLRGTAGAAIRAGYMRTESGRSWWLYRFGREALVIDLVDSPLEFIVVAADDNRGLADAITRAQDPGST